jgi:hypothetical protein
MATFLEAFGEKLFAYRGTHAKSRVEITLLKLLQLAPTSGQNPFSSSTGTPK